MDKHDGISLALSRLAHYELLEKQGKLVELPCGIGEDVYVICTCENIPAQLDGMPYDSYGGPGTATGYYCPYEDDCPFDAEDCQSCEGKEAVFKDVVRSIFIQEDGIEIIPENCDVCSILGQAVFLEKEYAEWTLKGGENSAEEV